MVIKVDFDLGITVQARDLERLLALQLPSGFQRYTPSTLSQKPLCARANVTM